MRPNSVEKDIVEELAGNWSAVDCLDRPQGFFLCRVLANVASPIKVERAEDLRTARLRLLSLSTDSPGHYVALNSETKQIVATVITSRRAPNTAN